MHPDDREAVGRELAEVLAHGRTPAPFRVRVVRPDGHMRWVETQSTVDDVSGLIYSVVHDVTDREETFMDRLAGAFRDAPLGMALVAPGGAFLRVNSTLCRMLGHTEPELLAESLADLVEDERVGQALRDGESSVQIETPMRHREGRPVVALVSATLVRDIRGEPQYYVCQVLDMTERYEAQATWPPTRPSWPRPSRSRAWALGVGDRLGPRHLVRRALPHLRRDARTTSRGPTAPISTRSTPTTAPASGASSRRP